MKRLFPLLLILLLIPCMIVPAAATTTPDWAVDDDVTVAQWLHSINSYIGRIWTYFPEYIGEIGSNLHIEGKSITEYILDVVDRLDWLDDSVRGVETQVINILEEIYTQGALTIGECVKGIRSYIVQINDKLETGVEKALGALVASVESYVRSIYNQLGGMSLQLSSIVKNLGTLITGDSSKVDEIVPDATQVQDDFSDMESILETSPEIDQEGFDSAVSGVNGKFDGITTDADGTLLFGALGELSNANIFRQLLPTTAMLGVLSFALFGRLY